MNKYTAESFKVTKKGTIFGITYYTIEINGKPRLDAESKEPALYTIKQIIELIGVYS